MYAHARRNRHSLITAMRLLSLIWLLHDKLNSSWVSAPRCILTGSCHLKDMWADNLIIAADRCSLSCRAERRWRTATVRARLRRINHQHRALLLLLGGCCSGTTCYKHEGKHAWSNALQRARSRF